jgi:predicted PurR-regulated permease PerM
MTTRQPAREPRPAMVQVGVLAGGLVLAFASVQVFRQITGVFMLLFISLFFSFAFEPLVSKLATHGWRRGVATGVVFLGVLVALLAIVVALVPLVLVQLGTALRSIPGLIGELSAALPIDITGDPEVAATANQIADRLPSLTLGLAGSLVEVGAGTLSFLLSLFTIGFVTFYMTADAPRVRRALGRVLRPEHQLEFVALWHLAAVKTGAYFSSRTLLTVICAVVHTIGLWLLGVPAPIALGVFIGLTAAFVPSVGTYIGGAAAIVFALSVSPTAAVLTLALITAYQQVENLYLAPRLQSSAMEIHPAVAFVSVIVGANLLGAVGAFLALPVAATAKGLISTFTQRNELIEELREEGVLPGAAPLTGATDVL